MGVVRKYTKTVACAKRHESGLGYSREWSNRTGAPACNTGCKCNVCGGRLHVEGQSHYCPHCDDFRPHIRGCKNA